MSELSRHPKNKQEFDFVEVEDYLTFNNCWFRCVVNYTKDGKNIITVVLGAYSGKQCNGAALKGQFEETNKLIQIGLAK